MSKFQSFESPFRIQPILFFMLDKSGECRYEVIDVRTTYVNQSITQNIFHKDSERCND